MGPTVAIIIVMFLAIAGGITASLLLMPGWQSSIALGAIYAGLLGYVSLSPQLIQGQMERATLGLGWVALLVAVAIRLVGLIRRGPTRTKTPV